MFALDCDIFQCLGRHITTTTTPQSPDAILGWDFLPSSVCYADINHGFDSNRGPVILCLRLVKQKDRVMIPQSQGHQGIAENSQEGLGGLFSWLLGGCGPTDILILASDLCNC